LFEAGRSGGGRQLLIGAAVLLPLLRADGAQGHRYVGALKMRLFTEVNERQQEHQHCKEGMADERQRERKQPATEIPPRRMFRRKRRRHGVIVTPKLPALFPWAGRKVGHSPSSECRATPVVVGL